MMELALACLRRDGFLAGKLNFHWDRTVVQGNLFISSHANAEITSGSCSCDTSLQFISDVMCCFSF